MHIEKIINGAGALSLLTASVYLSFITGAQAIITQGRYLPYREITIGDQPLPKYTYLFQGLNGGPLSKDWFYIPNGWTFASTISDKSSSLAAALNISGSSDTSSLAYTGLQSPSFKSLSGLIQQFPQNCKALMAGTINIGSRAICNLTLQAQKSGVPYSVILPIIIRDSTALYTISVQSMINQSGTNPFILKASAGGGGVSISGLFNTSYSSATKYAFDSTNVCDPNDPNLIGEKLRCGTSTGVMKLPNKPGLAATPVVGWAFASSGGRFQVPPGTAAGLYQVNIKATTNGDVLGRPAAVQYAYQTVYVNVGNVDNNFFFSGMQPLSLLYLYNGGKVLSNYTGVCSKIATTSACTAPSQSSTYNQTVFNQCKDLQKINQTFQSNNYDLEVAVTAIGQLLYQDCANVNLSSQCNFWSTASQNSFFDGYSAGSANPIKGSLGTIARISSAAGMGNVDMSASDQTSVCAYSSVIGPQSGISTQLMLDFEQGKGAGILAGSSMSAELGSQNDAQSAILAAAHVKQIFNRPGYIGVSTDFESGFTQDPYYTFLKNLSDRLAFRGNMLGSYDFAYRGFSPGIVTALGPAGLAIFSAYDVTNDRAPNNVGGVSYNIVDLQNGGQSLQNQSLTSPQALYYANMLSPNQPPPPLPAINCSNVLSRNGGVLNKNPGICLDSLYDSYSENVRGWTGQQYYGNFTPYEVFKNYFGRFVPLLPIAESASQSPYNVITKQNLTFGQYQGKNTSGSSPIVVAMGTKTNPTSPVTIAAALGQSPVGVVTSANSVPFEAFYGCPGAPSDYTSCLMVSAPVIFHNTPVGSGYRFASVEDYLIIDNKVYQNLPSPFSKTVDPMMIGIGFFGLGDALAESNSGCVTPGSSSVGQNINCMEPWYVGFNTTPYGIVPSVDTFYSSYQSNNVNPDTPANLAGSKLLAPLIDNYNLWRTANNLLANFAAAKGLPSGPKAYNVVSWVNRGLPIKPFSGTVSAQITTDAALIGGNYPPPFFGAAIGGAAPEIRVSLPGTPISGAITYKCYVLSHSTPIRTCALVQSGKTASLSLSSPPGMDDDYAIFVRASAGSQAIFTDSVYINLK